MAQIVIIAGPNGAGKTSFATEYLVGSKAGWPFVNADEIVGELSALPAAQRDVRAARVMSERIANLVQSKRNFALETTLATLSYAQKIPRWQALGYSVGLIYLRLPSIARALARVRKRVEAGGHDIPEGVLRRRFHKGLEYLDRVYKPMVDEWYVFDSLEGEFREAEAWTGEMGR